MSNFYSKKFRFLHILYIMSTVICLEVYEGKIALAEPLVKVRLTTVKLMEEYPYHMGDEHNSIYLKGLFSSL